MIPHWFGLWKQARLRTNVAAVLAAMFLSAGCSNPSPLPNIVLVLIDTLRADRVGWYQNDRKLTPFLDSLAEHGDVFWQAYAQSSWTSPSVASLLTSRYPSQHAVVRIGAVLGPTEIRLPALLRAHGYATGGFSANPLIGARWGYAEGFDHFVDAPDEDTIREPNAKQRAERINSAALSWLDSLKDRPGGARPVFLYLHYMEPHAPYLPPRESLEAVLDRSPDPDRARKSLGDMLFVSRQRFQQPDPEALELIKDLYDAEVLGLDARLRTLFADLQGRGVLANAIVVVTADHGEEFKEHGHMGHGYTLYNEVIHVPLMLAIPGQHQRVDLQGPVSLIDLAPTLLDFAGVTPPASFEGHSLRPLLERSARPGASSAPPDETAGGPRDAPPLAYSELLEKARVQDAVPPRHLRAVIAGTEKAIACRDGSTETYDLVADPGETDPRSADRDRPGLVQHIDQMAQRTLRNRSQGRVETLDERTKQRMHALGYL